MSIEFSLMEIIDDLGKSIFCETGGDYFQSNLLEVKFTLIFRYGGLIFLEARFTVG